MDEPRRCRRIFGAELQSHLSSHRVLFADSEMTRKVLSIWGRFAGNF